MKLKLLVSFLFLLLINATIKPQQLNVTIHQPQNAPNAEKLNSFVQKIVAGLQNPKLDSFIQSSIKTIFSEYITISDKEKIILIPLIEAAKELEKIDFSKLAAEQATVNQSEFSKKYSVVYQESPEKKALQEKIDSLTKERDQKYPNIKLITDLNSYLSFGDRTFDQEKITAIEHLKSPVAMSAQDLKSYAEYSLKINDIQQQMWVISPTNPDNTKIATPNYDLFTKIMMKISMSSMLIALAINQYMKTTNKDHVPLIANKAITILNGILEAIGEKPIVLKK